jgi:hypothetical protein
LRAAVPPANPHLPPLVEKIRLEGELPSEG